MGVVLYLFFGIIFLLIIYNIIESAVKNGTLRALIEYDEIKNKHNEKSQ